MNKKFYTSFRRMEDATVKKLILVILFYAVIAFSLSIFFSLGNFTFATLNSVVIFNEKSFA
jgi:hypothetical protein